MQASTNLDGTLLQVGISTANTPTVEATRLSIEAHPDFSAAFAAGGTLAGTDPYANNLGSDIAFRHIDRRQPI